MPSLDEQALMIYNKRMLRRGLPTRQVEQTVMYCYLRLQMHADVASGWIEPGEPPRTARLSTLRRRVDVDVVAPWLGSLQHFKIPSTTITGKALEWKVARLQ